MSYRELYINFGAPAVIMIVALIAVWLHGIHIKRFDEEMRQLRENPPPE